MARSTMRELHEQLVQVETKRDEHIELSKDLLDGDSPYSGRAQAHATLALIYQHQVSVLLERVRELNREG